MTNHKNNYYINCTNIKMSHNAHDELLYDLLQAESVTDYGSPLYPLHVAKLFHVTRLSETCRICG